MALKPIIKLLKRSVVALFWMTTLIGCTSPEARFAARALQAHLTMVDVPGTEFTHRIYRRAASAASDRVLVFIEGDSGWRDDKPVYVYDKDRHSAGVIYTRKPARDPTPSHPLAFNLMLRTDKPAWYITRPCYNGLFDAACNERVWTSERYSDAVISSMAKALERYASSQPQVKFVLVGYSGGGVIATLLASRVQQVVGVVAIAANLDTAKWTDAMHYEPLAGSLNPAADRSHLSVPLVLLAGDQDTQVPFATLSRFIDAYPQTRVLHFEQYDHVCCWERDWPMLLERALKQLGVAD